MRNPSLRTLAAVAFLASAAPSLAQTNTTPQQPFLYDAQVTTSPSQIAPSKPRRSLEFCNPNASITVAICPVWSRRSGAGAVTCAVNGRGSVTLPPSTCWGKSVPLQASPLESAWNGVAASGTANITVFETE